ncbi:MAG: TspO/MBR family protein [Syntrophotaleaceae bacterium]
MNKIAAKSVKQQWAGLLGWILLAFAAAAIGGAASVGAEGFYQQLNRPSWAPPGWLFGPVWTLLYLLIGISGWLLWRRHGVRRAKFAFTLYFLQLAANALWTWLFFAWRQGGLAFAEILLLWSLIVATIFAFWRLQAKIAAILLLPYLAWVTFASVLAFSMWQHNPGLLG